MSCRFLRSGSLYKGSRSCLQDPFLSVIVSFGRCRALRPRIEEMAELSNVESLAKPINKMLVTDLKEALKERGQDTKGLKAELVDRLQVRICESDCEIPYFRP